MNKVRYIWITILFLPWIIGVSAQDISFEAKAPASVRVGQQFQYTIEGNERGEVSLPDLQDFEVVGGPFSSYSSSTQWVNGKMTTRNNVSFTYILRCNQSGTYVIPPATIRVKRDSYETNPVEISVGDQGQPASAESQSQTPTAERTDEPEAEKSDVPVFLRIIPSRREVYVGEQLVSALKIYTKVNTRPAAGIKEIPYEGFYKHTLEGDENATRETIDGQRYLTQVLQRHVLIPQKSGKIVIEPFESEWMIQKRVQRKRPGSALDEFFDDPFFNDPFFDSYQNVPVTLSTKPVTIQVNPLPGNPPDGYTGAVGDFNMTATLSANRVDLNDALNLKITITGTGNLSLLGAPPVDLPPEHDVYETNRTSNIQTSGNRISGSLVFEYPIVARAAGKFRIAPVRFSWFDPASETYKTISSDEFRFEVEKGDEAPGQGSVVVPGNRGERVENIGTDILDIARSHGKLTARSSSMLSSPWYWAAYAMMLVVFLAIVLLLKRHIQRRADSKLVKNRKANRMARKRLRNADRARKQQAPDRFFEETEKAIWGYLADKLGLDHALLSREYIDQILDSRQVEDSLRKELLETMNECEFSRYAPSTEKSNMDQTYERAVKLIRKLEHKLR